MAVCFGAMTGLGARGVPPAATLLHLGAVVEELGYDALWVGEGMVRPNPLLDSAAVLASFVTQTRRLRIGANVFLLPLRHPVALARVVTTLDYLSGGRFTCGVGVGGAYPEEFETLGVPVHRRGRIADEALEVLVRLWTEPSVTHAGEFFRLRDIVLEPKPVQRPHPPLWVGGTSPAALRRTARFGQGWLAYLVSPDELREGAEKIRELAGAYGRGDAQFSFVASLFAYCGESYEAAVRAAGESLRRSFRGQNLDTHKTLDEQPSAIVQRYAAVGRPEDCAATIARFIEAGATDVILNPLAPGDEVEEHLTRFAREVLPLLRARSATAEHATDQAGGTRG
jgi:probable F420-dependent oxidoreductase